MSDWGATKTAAAAANGGLDLVMPGPRGPWGDQLVAAVRSGDVAEATIDDHLTRLLRLAGRVGALRGIAAESTAELGPRSPLTQCDAAQPPKSGVGRDGVAQGRRHPPASGFLDH